MERNFEAEAAEMRVSEADRWESAQHMWDLAHEGQSDNYVPDEPEPEQDQTPTGDRYYPAIAGAISAACRDWQYWDLGGMDGPDPYAELQAALQRAVEEVQSLRGHEHQWTEQDYCSICGRDGRA